MIYNFGGGGGGCHNLDFGGGKGDAELTLAGVRHTHRLA